MTRTVVPDRPPESRIDELVGESADRSRRGDWSAAVRCQRQAVDLTGELLDDAQRRTGLGGLCYRSANAALGYYGHPDANGNDADDSVDSGYVHSAAVVSALLNFVDGRGVEGFVPAAVIAAGLPPGQARQALEAELRVVDGLLSMAGGPVPFPPEMGPPPEPAAYLPVWQRLLEVATGSCRAAGDHPLADDLDAWRARLG
ncbi:hypothetical protein O7621_00190 [Solwaraspora sp. WMMD937]|uniref:hypothetical protein n=1 Tax=Solwaraspora sp. WMMD937 TaxID=3016090 RepID=UPI00249A4167|nr:hypothetical protein [Solwaraspora sp. WMMD937]WFE21858.1 hypothetical protein O7621_00190 [Solwaraspora sp. WMMD937]